MINKEFEPTTERLIAVRGKASELLEGLSPELTYHDYNHTMHPSLGVAAVTYNLAGLEGVTGQDRELLTAAAYLHDIGHLVQDKDHEAIGARMSGEFLPSFGYASEEVERIQNYIRATSIQGEPTGIMEKVIRDADVDALGRPDFFEISEKLRQEWGIKDQKEWLTGQINFLAQHMFYTGSCYERRENTKHHNMLVLRAQLHALDGGIPPRLVGAYAE